MEKSEQIQELAAAMVAAQGEITGAAKDSTNPHFRSSYADLSSVMEACKGALNRHGIAVLQPSVPSEPGTLAIDTLLMHTSGQWVSGRTVIPLQKNDPQGFGSAMTYARRYSLAAMVGVCPEDDDGEGAMNRGNQRPAPQQRNAPAARQNQNVSPLDGEKFIIQVNELLESRGFTAEEIDHVHIAACKQKKVESVAALSADNRAALIKAISDGKFDKLRKVAA